MTIETKFNPGQKVYFFCGDGIACREIRKIKIEIDAHYFGLNASFKKVLYDVGGGFKEENCFYETEEQFMEFIDWQLSRMKEKSEL